MPKGNKSFEELSKQLSEDPGNYRLNVEMGFYYLDHDRKQTYQYLKRALRFCDSATDTGAIEQLFTDMEYVYPELMSGTEQMAELLNEGEEAEFKAVLAGVEMHGLAHQLESSYPKASFMWNADAAQVYKTYHEELDYLFIDTDEVLGAYPGIVLRGVRTVLKPGGSLILRASNAAWYGRILKSLEGKNPDESDAGPLFHPYMKDELCQLIQNCGYDPVFDENIAKIPKEDDDLLKSLLFQAETSVKCMDINAYKNRYHYVRATRRES